MPSAAEIQAYLSANPGMSDADIAAAMNQYGVSTADMAAATGSNLEDIQSRYDAVAAPAAPEPVYEPPAPVYEPPAPVYEPVAVPTYSSTDEQGNPIYETPATVATPTEPVYTPPVVETPGAPTGIAALTPTTPVETPTGVAALAPTTPAVVAPPTAPVVTPTGTPANQLSGVILAGASWLAGDEKTNLAKEAFGENVTNTAIGGQKTSDVLNQLNQFENTKWKKFIKQFKSRH